MGRKSCVWQPGSEHSRELAMTSISFDEEEEDMV